MAREYMTELGELKSRLEWTIVMPRRVWRVEGHLIIRRRSGTEYRDVYQIDREGEDGGTVAVQPTLTDAFRWVADQAADRR